MNAANVAARLHRFEGSIPHMYQCTGGKVTIGVGHAIESSLDACFLPLQNPTDVIKVDYVAVSNAPPDLVATAYAGLTTSRMTDANIEDLLNEDIEAYQLELEEALPNFDSYPEPAQEALFDMGFNLGIAGLMKFPNMLAAVDRGDWETAAAECHRLGIPEDRNEETASLFMLCLPGASTT